MGKRDRKGRSLLLVGGAALLLGLMLVEAGSLQPPGPPAPTMRTLDEIYAVLASLGAGGQTVGTENRLKGCVRIIGTAQGVIRSRESADAADPACSAFGEEGIRVIAMSHDINVPLGADGQPAGQRRHAPLTLTKHTDGATPLLMKALQERESLSEVELRWYRTAPEGGGQQHYLTIRLGNAKVVGVTPTVLATPQNYLHLEEVAFVYSQIRWTWAESGAEFQDTWLSSGPGG